MHKVRKQMEREVANVLSLRREQRWSAGVSWEHMYATVRRGFHISPDGNKMPELEFNPSLGIIDHLSGTSMTYQEAIVKTIKDYLKTTHQI